MKLRLYLAIASGAIFILGIFFRFQIMFALEALGIPYYVSEAFAKAALLGILPFAIEKFQKKKGIYAENAMKQPWKKHFLIRLCILLSPFLMFLLNYMDISMEVGYVLTIILVVSIWIGLIFLIVESVLLYRKNSLPKLYSNIALIFLYILLYSEVFWMS